MDFLKSQPASPRKRFFRPNIKTGLVRKRFRGLVQNSFKSVALVVGKMNQVVGRKLGMDDFPHGEPAKRANDQRRYRQPPLSPAACQEQKKYRTSRQKYRLSATDRKEEERFLA